MLATPLNPFGCAETASERQISLTKVYSSLGAQLTMAFRLSEGEMRGAGANPNAGPMRLPGSFIDSAALRAEQITNAAPMLPRNPTNTATGLNRSCTDAAPKQKVAGHRIEEGSNTSALFIAWNSLVSSQVPHNN